MRIVSLLFVWSLSFLQPGGFERSICSELADAARHNGLATDVVRNARNESCPVDASGSSLCQSLAEDDDSLEDGAFAFGVSPTWRLPAQVRGNLSALAPLQDVRLRIPPCPHPMRC